MSDKKNRLFGRLFGKEGRKDQSPSGEANGNEPDEAAPVEVQTEPPAPSPAGAGEPPTSTPPPEQHKKGWFTRLRSGLSKSSSSLTHGITRVFTGRRLDEDTLQDLEDILIQADLGVDTALSITDEISSGRFDKGITAEQVREVLAEEVAKVLEPVAVPLQPDESKKPHVILMVGVNGSGKTTTIGKLASQFKIDGKQVMLAAGDTFRAAAIDQLKIWGERVDAPVVSSKVGSDAAGLAYDALSRAQAQGTDILLIDTAGRLQNKANLMAELEKIVRVLRKLDGTAPHSVLLVLDATTGQNALNQVQVFQQTAGITGLIMTKLDGTARGGILVAISAKYGLPVHAIGIGEGLDDLQPFNAGEFARAIAFG